MSKKRLIIIVLISLIIIFLGIFTFIQLNKNTNDNNPQETDNTDSDKTIDGKENEDIDIYNEDEEQPDENTDENIDTTENTERTIPSNLNTNIDRTAPVITIADYIKTSTNKDITVRASTNEGALNTSSHTFTKNGNFEFIATDTAGNVTRKTVTIDNIDKTPPVITIDDYIKVPTNQNVTVKAGTNEGTLNAKTHIYTENSTFDFVATDIAGNITKKTVKITNIDKAAPKITINNYIKTPTNQNITVTASTNEGTLNTQTHTFIENESFEFVVTDTAGNVTKETVIITNIDKVAPVITIADYTQTPTNQDITVTASTNEGTLDIETYTFTENGSFEFIATDTAGNITRKTVIITNIDKVAPVITIADYTQTPTNQDITVTASTNEGTLDTETYTFTENGSFEFIATDTAENVTRQTVTITNIDKVAPVITIADYTQTPTNQDITVTASTNEGILNTETHTFIENGSFEFVATDTAGNVTRQTVTIINIDKVAPVITIADYTQTPTNQDITVTASTNEGTLNTETHTFIENGSFEFVATDTAGNVTRQTVTITNIDKVAPVITIADYTQIPTNQDITVTASTNEGTLNVTSHLFTENDSFEFVATDAVGNITRRTVAITNIDKTSPVITIGNYITTPTNQNITVTASTNEGTLNATSHLFTENDSFEFVATDTAGNIARNTVIITNIDKVAPVITIGNYITIPTNQNITVTASTNEGTLNATSHLFTGNGSFEFTATDAVGNVGRNTVTITNIDKTPPVITVNPKYQEIRFADSYNPLNGVSATDSGSGIKGNITSNFNSLWIYGLGLHTITYTVQDNAGNTATNTRTLMVTF